MKIEAEQENFTKQENFTEQEKDEVFKPSTRNTLPILSYVKNKNKANIKTKNQNAKGKKKTKEDIIPIKNTITIKKVKAEEQEDCVDVETIPRDEIPILEAHDTKSLLEKFEACENPNPCNKSIVKNDHTYDTRPNKTCQVSQECRANISEKSISQVFNQQPSILSKKTIKLNKTKMLERRKTSPKIAMPNIQSTKRKSTQMQDRVFCNKILKIDSTVSNDAKSTTVSRTLVQLDHDYCNNDNFCTKSYNSNKTTKHTSVLKLSQNDNLDGLNQHERHYKTDSSYEQCHLEFANIYDGNGKPAVLQNEIEDNWLENDHKCCQKETPLKHAIDLNNSSVRNINISNVSPTVTPLLDSIRSPLARKIILQSQKYILPKTNSIQTNPKTQYISVLKNPPNASQSQFSINNPNENMVTIMNNSNNKVQNIIGQNTQNMPPHEEDKTSRVKISVLEYRKRILNDKTRNNKCMIMEESFRTILVDIYHASTMTLPLGPDQEIKDTFYCQREVMPCWKKQSDIQEEKNKPKPSTRDVQTETDENIFKYLKSVDVEEEERDVKIVEINKKREESTKNKKQKSCERVSHSLSRSRSKSRSRCTTSESSNESRNRSRSKSRDRRSKSKSQNRSRRRSRSKSRTRNRNRSRSVSTSTSKSRSSSKNKSSSRSRSRSRIDRRSSRRTISHRTRRSSVTSTSSWSSPASISMRSKHSYSSSSSRSDIRSRSRSPERFYSKRSRSPSTSNLRRNKWSNKRRKDSRDRERSYDKYDRRERSYDKYEKRSLTNRHVNRSYRSPLDSCSETYDDWHNRKKQREIEERRVVYVGRIDEGITKSDLRKRFEIFGPVEDISVHFREHGENYGFVTFLYNNDAYEAVEHGNDNPSLPEYTLSFGGRRAFCKSKYADLDNVEDGAPKRRPHINEDMSYDYLLKSTAYMLKRKV
ncbi:Peroxisome proliferator-activated receptor gamma coactivator-related protein 1 [Trachymyrmex septentrionalis]|uniref:Peroxisome proliferator-activated receptor gamma coactivator-related protein 1 n=1 Tax=Trachymyrmex septentrionalis TaxID=34720 RepID=A0A195F235_9HYME|nr:Peroxisome proliferator-activated receptor gamma coactivator-related protein 1 [Trachymyrmex septentrionalis]